MDALDDALTVFAATAPSYGQLGLANHGPMAAEALDRLGRADAIENWVARYRRRLDDAPPPAAPLARGGLARCPGRRGALSRVARPLRAASWPTARRRRGGRMGAPPAARDRRARPPTGSSAPATPCAASMPPTRRPAGWSWPPAWPSGPRRYQELPGPPLLIGHQGVPEALAALPYLPEDGPRAAADQRHGGPGGRHRRGVRAGRVIARPGRWERPSCSTSWPPAGRWPTCATPMGAAPSACSIRSPRPWPASSCCPGSRRRTATPPLGYAWQAVAALHVAYALDRHGPAPARGASSAEALVDMAVASGDEHAIKLTEAALRAYKRCGDPTLLWAAADACARF